MSVQQQPDQKVRILSWQEIMSVIGILADRIPVSKYLYLWGLPRNGMILAGILAHKTGLKIRHPDNYDFTRRRKSDILIVDDIHDSGETANEYMAMGYEVATLFWRKKEKENAPTYFVETVEDNAWLQFPWENDNAAGKSCSGGRC